MDKVDIIRKHIGNDDFYDINGTPLLTKILSAMDEYAQQQVKNCSIPAVVGRSELLKAFVEWQIQGNTPYAGMFIDEHIRAYFKSL